MSVLSFKPCSGDDIGHRHTEPSRRVQNMYNYFIRENEIHDMSTLRATSSLYYSVKSRGDAVDRSRNKVIDGAAEHDVNSCGFLRYNL
ncbi:hypothetical protein J6590_028757 [Homalodisca vitripennis]|nr:hypothetical protein J6590_028757 [Homalodisca vitripennis]